MTQDEAKAILQSCLASDREPADERMAEALSMLERDSELATWFENEMSFDATVREKLAEVAPPPGLKARILAQAPATGQTPIPFPAQERRWWQNPKFISLAACIIIIFTFGALLFDPQTLVADPDIPDFYEDVADVSQKAPELEARSESLDELRQYLAKKGAPVPGQLPSKVDPLVEVGASYFYWQDVPVALVRMGEGEVYHLYVIDLTVFGSDDTPPAMAEWHQSGEVGLMAWADHGHLYVLTLVGSSEQLKAFK